LKDNHGGRTVQVRGAAKVMCHLMFGVLSFTALQLLRLVAERPFAITIAALAATFGGEAATGLPKEVGNPVAGLCGHLNQVRSPRFQISVHLPSGIRAFAQRSFASGSISTLISG